MLKILCKDVTYKKNVQKEEGTREKRRRKNRKERRKRRKRERWRKGRREGRKQMGGRGERREKEDRGGRGRATTAAVAAADLPNLQPAVESELETLGRLKCIYRIDITHAGPLISQTDHPFLPLGTSNPIVQRGWGFANYVPNLNLNFFSWTAFLFIYFFFRAAFIKVKLLVQLWSVQLKSIRREKERSTTN